LRFFGWDRSGLPIREKSAYIMSAKDASFLATEESLVARGPRSVIYNAIVELALGVVSQSKRDALEFRRLLNWSVENMVDPAEWPAGAVMRRLSRVYDASKPSAADLEDLRLLLEDLSGETWREGVEPVEMPFTTPEPAVEFRGKEFVFAGDFLYGKQACKEELWPRGATYGETVTSRTDYLVIGALQSVHWRTGAIGEAIDRAILVTEDRPPGLAPIQIISEAVWYRATFGQYALTPKAAMAIV
jgi:hypothetical protein